ncbi:shikimate kinase [Acidovorax sp. CCYZU-2555]|uniref:shikimate kinase n=1 Tax=Acidovorax sp. CCYZU-2555 TaxID=2835042 RepID=UPI001BCF48A9|nr:shikimate kinase [Acidovorax sp. CCYZU-2555]MBS7779699.1 shikimate kinase [Acidovorax sp. CCYZU-2555]
MYTLIGLPGSGKTTIGKQLAQLWGMGFVDSDQVIEQRLGCTIAAYFSAHGEAAFRDVEQQVIDEITAAPSQPLLLSTGGGVVLREANRLHLRSRSTVFYLQAAPDDIARRLRNDTTRPLLKGQDPGLRLRELMHQRHALYLATAHYTIKTARLSVTQVVRKLAMQAELGEYDFPAPHGGEMAPQR